MQKWEYMKLRVEWTYTSSEWRFVYENKHYSADDIISALKIMGNQAAGTGSSDTL